MSYLFGYARVSTGSQDDALQLDALRDAGCDRVFRDVASGSEKNRPELARLWDQLREGDTLVVWRLDRLGRSLKELISQVQELGERGVEFRSLRESIDTTTPTGRLFFHMFGALAEFERDLIRERTHAGLAAARARGRTGGRPRALDSKQVSKARRAYAAGTFTVAEIAEDLGVSRATIHRVLKDEGTT